MDARIEERITIEGPTTDAIRREFAVVCKVEETQPSVLTVVITVFDRAEGWARRR